MVCILRMESDGVYNKDGWRVMVCIIRMEVMVYIIRMESDGVYNKDGE